MVSISATSFQATPGLPVEPRWAIYPLPKARPNVQALAVTTSGDRYVEMPLVEPACREDRPALSERDYPVLAAIWDNEADAIYDDL